MKRGPTIALVAGAAALAVVAAMLLRRGDDTPPATAGQAFVPGLAELSPEIGAVEVLRGNATVRLERTADGAWTVATSDGYPAQTELVRGLVVSLGTLTLDEPMTAKPDRHGDLGLAWPDATGKARRVRMLRAAPGAAPVADVVLGDERAAPDTIFVRTFDQPQTWRARGRVQLQGDALGWVNRSLMALPEAEVTSATLRGLTLTRPEGPAPTSGPPRPWVPTIAPDATWGDRQVQSAQMGLAPFLQRLEFDGVRRARVDATPEPKYSPVFETRGATVQISAHRETDGVWFRVTITPRPDAPPPTPNPAAGDPFVPNYAQLAAQTSGWEFRMPDWKADSLDRTLVAEPPTPSGPKLPHPSPTEEPTK